MSTDETTQLLFTIATISSIPTVIINAFLITWMCYQNMDQPIAKWSVCAITFLAACCSFIGWYGWENQQLTLTGETIIFLGIFISWQTGTVSIYVLFIKRLRITFNGTKYDSSKKVYFALSCGCVCFFSLQFITLTCHIFELHNAITAHEYFIIAAILFTSEQAFDFILSVSFLTIFINKLKLLNIDIGLNHLSSHDSNGDLELNDVNPKQSSSLNDQQLIIIKSLSKITILSCIAIISTQFFLVYEGILFWLGHPERLNAIRYIAMAVDCMINSVTVVLNFDFANNWYYSLCRPCDYCITRICTYETIKEQNNLKQSLLLQKSVQNA